MEGFENRTGTHGQHNSEGAKWTGIVLILIGLAFLGRNLTPDFPRWVFQWEMILIVVGILVGIRHQFRGAGWFIMVAIGGISLLGHFIPVYSKPQLTWATIAIAIGLYLILKPKPKTLPQTGIRNQEEGVRDWENYPATEAPVSPAEVNEIEVLDATSIFGTVKKVVMSKNFRGGDVTAIMGGAEIDLSKADIKGKVRIDATNIMGGTELIVPPTWYVKSNVVAILGGVEDKRDPRFLRIESDKILVLEGVSLFGGIEIKSY